jgi:hypothetical protein
MFRQITTCTIAIWLKTALISSGIDVEMFKVHSYRSAATSAALQAGEYHWRAS